MNTASRLLMFAFTTAFSFGTLQAASPFRVGEGNSITLSSSGNSALLERELFRQMDRYVVYPVMTNDPRLFGDVVVDLVIDAQGRIQIVDLQASQPALGDYVRAKLAKVDVGENPSGVWNTSHIRFRFRPQA